MFDFFNTPAKHEVGKLPKLIGHQYYFYFY